MKTFNVYITYKDRTADSTQVCGENFYDAADVIRDFIWDEHKNLNDVSDIEFEQWYDTMDHREYGNDYEW